MFLEKVWNTLIRDNQIDCPQILVGLTKSSDRIVKRYELNEYHDSMTETLIYIRY